MAHERVVLVRRLGGGCRRCRRRRRHGVRVVFDRRLGNPIGTLRDRRLATQTFALRARLRARRVRARVPPPRATPGRRATRSLVRDERFRELDERLQRRRLRRLRRGVHLRRARRRAILRDFRFGFLHETGNRRADLRVSRDGRHVRRRLRVEPRAKRRVLGAIDSATIRAAFPGGGPTRSGGRPLGQTPSVLKLHGDGVVDVVGDVGVAPPGYGRGGRVGGGGGFGRPRASSVAPSGGVDDAGADRLAARDRGWGLRGDRCGEAHAVRRCDERRAVRGGARFDLGALGGLSFAILGVGDLENPPAFRAAREDSGRRLPYDLSCSARRAAFAASRAAASASTTAAEDAGRRTFAPTLLASWRSSAPTASTRADASAASRRARDGGGCDRRGGWRRAESDVGRRLVRGGRALEGVQGGALRRAPLERPGGDARSVQDVTRAVQERREVVAAGRDVVERGGDRRGNGHGRNVRHREGRVASEDGARATSVGGHRAARAGDARNDESWRKRSNSSERFKRPKK